MDNLMDDASDLLLVTLLVVIVLDCRFIMILAQVVVDIHLYQVRLKKLIHAMSIIWINLQAVLHKLSNIDINVLPDRLAKIEYFLW